MCIYDKIISNSIESSIESSVDQWPNDWQNATNAVEWLGVFFQAKSYADIDILGRTLTRYRSFSSCE